MSFPRAIARSSVLTTLTLMASAACSSSSSTTTNTPQDPGVTAGGDETPQGRETNPYGVAYPTAGIGFKARNDPASQSAGDKIKNYKFLGYIDSDKGKGLQTISLADLYDPEMKQFKLIHVSVAGVWCTWCIQEVHNVVPLVPQLKDKKVIFLTALSEDLKHGPAKQTDLDYWVDVHRTNYTQVLDPGNRNLGPFFTSAGIPWNGNIDARTMEILSSSTGAPVGVDNQVDIMGDVQPWLDWIDAHPIGAK